MPSSEARVQRFESPLDPQAGWPGMYLNVRQLPMLLLKDPLALFVKRRKFLHGSLFIPRCDMTQAVETP